jgi:hypothetical protein
MNMKAIIGCFIVLFVVASGHPHVRGVGRRIQEINVTESQNGITMSPCSLCTNVTEIFQHIVGSNITKAMVIIAIDEVCERVVPELSTLCEKFIGKFTMKLIHYMLDHNSTRNFCSFVHLCPNATNVDISNQNICRDVMQQSREIRKTPVDPRDVVMFLDRVCEMYTEIPKFEIKCDNFIKSHLSNLIQCLSTRKSNFRYMCNDVMS